MTILDLGMDSDTRSLTIIKLIQESKEIVSDDFESEAGK